MKAIKPKAFYRVSFCDLPWKENKGNFEAFLNGKMIGNLSKSFEFTILFEFRNEHVWTTLTSKDFTSSTSLNLNKSSALTEEDIEIIDPNFKVFVN